MRQYDTFKNKPLTPHHTGCCNEFLSDSFSGAIFSTDLPPTATRQKWVLSGKLAGYQFAPLAESQLQRYPFTAEFTQKMS